MVSVVLYIFDELCRRPCMYLSHSIKHLLARAEADLVGPNGDVVYWPLSVFRLPAIGSTALAFYTLGLEADQEEVIVHALRRILKFDVVYARAVVISVIANLIDLLH